MSSCAGLLVPLNVIVDCSTVMFVLIAVLSYSLKIKSAIDNYPDGIGSEGYTQIAFSLLTAGCKDDDEKENVFKSMFYGENA